MRLRRHLLGVLERSTIGKIGSDPGRPKSMIANGRVDARGRRAPADMRQAAD